MIIPYQSGSYSLILLGSEVFFPVELKMKY